jgi:hypothetical protein
LRSWRAFSFAGSFRSPGASWARLLFMRRRIGERRKLAVETPRPLWKEVVSSSQVSPFTALPRTSTREQAPAVAASVGLDQPRSTTRWFGRFFTRKVPTGW